MASISEDVYNILRSEILDGTFVAGESLREEQLAGRYGTSRTPVREALRRLDAEGIVSVIRHRGARVLEWKPNELGEVFALRGQLESYAARIAASHISKDDIDLLTKLAGEMEEIAFSTSSEVVIDAITPLNNHFHSVIVASAGNGRLSEQLSSVIQVATVRNTFRRYNHEQLIRSMSHHRELIAAYMVKDGEWAESVMKSHIYSARAVLSVPPKAEEIAISDRRP